MKKQEKKAISLIVLVITIIVMIILAGTVIITLSSSGIIGKAKEAVDKTNFKRVQEIAQVIWLDCMQNNEDAATIKSKIIAQLGDIASKYDITVDNGGVKIKDKSGDAEQPEVTIAYGLYKTGTNYTELIYSWEDMIADGVIILTELVELPEKNEHGFYYGIKYDDYGYGFVFYENGSVDIYSNNRLDQTLPAGSAAYSNDSINLSDSGYGIITISSDGKDVTDDYGYSYTLSFDRGGVVYGCDATLEGDLMLPNDGSVISIGDYTKLGSYEWTGNPAFMGCEKLTGIIIPKSATYVSYGAFNGCTSLTSVIFESDSQLTEIAGYAFNSCEALTSIEIPAKVEVIGEYAFAYNPNLSSIIFEENSQWSYEDRYTFYKCTSLTSIEIPASLQQFGTFTFSECTNLQEVTFEENSMLNSIGYATFDRCTSLKEINIPATLTYMDELAFYGCTSLSKVRFGENIQLAFFGEDAFSGCTSLTSIGPVGSGADFEIPDSVVSLGADVFTSCTGLTSIRFGENLTDIAKGVFKGCRSLTSIGPVGSGASVEIPANITNIGNSFASCIGIVTVELPDTITGISDSAFEGCTSLQRVTIAKNSSISTIECESFRSCSALEEINLPKSIRKIRLRAFKDCTSLRKIEYDGTTTEWQQNGKYLESTWDDNTGDYIVYCTNGTVAKDGTVTLY